MFAMPWAICRRSSLRMPSRMTQSAESGPQVAKRKLNCLKAKSGFTVSSSLGSSMVFIAGSTSPSSPGKNQRAPSFCKKPLTALKLPRSSRPQTSSVSPSSGILARCLYKPGFGSPYGAPTILSHSACARGMSLLFRAKGPTGSKSASSPISAIQSAPVAMRYAPSLSPSVFTGHESLAPMNTLTALPEGCVTMGSFAPLIFSICCRNSCAATR